MPNYLRGILLNLVLLTYIQHASVFGSCKPLDTVAVVNQSTIFNCSTEVPKIVWHYSAVGSDETLDGDIVYRDGNLFAKYITDFHVDEYEINGTYFCNLIIKTVKENLAGKYECRDMNGVRMIQSAQLIVIDSNPICRPDSEPVGIIGLNDCGLEPEEVGLSCSVNYFGNISPVLKWTADVNHTQVVLNVTHEISINRTTSIITMNPGNYVYDAKFKCQAIQSIGEEQLCTVDFRVLYAMNTTMRIDKVVGDEVNCSVNTNSHSCHYEWIKLDDKGSSTVSNSSVLKIENSGLHQCQVTCDLLDKKCLIFGTTVNASESAINKSPEEGLSGAAIVAIVISFFLILILTLGIVFLCIRRKCREIFYQNVEPGISANSISSTLASVNHNKSLFENVTPKFPYTLAACAENNFEKAIAGVAVCKEKLFVVFEGSSTVEVFHAITFAFEDSFIISNLSNPLDIASCPAEDCIFIYAFGNDSSGEILVMDRSGSILLSWKTGEGVGRLSVALDSSVILSVWSSCLLKVYSADGLHLKDVKLPSNIQPFHALKLTEEEFVISYKEKNQKFHGIYLVNSNGEQIGNISQAVDFPRYLSQTSDGECLIADSKNSRILLLTRTFELVDILSAKHGLIRPVRIYFDYSNGQRLFVADNGERNHRVMIYEFPSND